MKKTTLLLMICMFVVTLAGCSNESTTINVTVEDTESLNNTIFGLNALIKIGNGLYYDSSTHIVYWWNGYLGEDSWSTTRTDTTPSPYYAPNGLPYKYNPETNTFEEINNE